MEDVVVTIGRRVVAPGHQAGFFVGQVVAVGLLVVVTIGGRDVMIPVVGYDDDDGCVGSGGIV